MAPTTGMDRRADDDLRREVLGPADVPVAKRLVSSDIDRGRRVDLRVPTISRLLLEDGMAEQTGTAGSSWPTGRAAVAVRWNARHVAATVSAA